MTEPMRRDVLLDGEARAVIVPMLLAIWRFECLESQGPVRLQDFKKDNRLTKEQLHYLNLTVEIGWLRRLKEGRTIYLAITRQGGNVARLEFTQQQAQKLGDIMFGKVDG